MARSPHYYWVLTKTYPVAACLDHCIEYRVSHLSYWRLGGMAYPDLPVVGKQIKKPRQLTWLKPGEAMCYWTFAALRSSSWYLASDCWRSISSSWGLTWSSGGNSAVRVSSSWMTCQPNELCTGA